MELDNRIKCITSPMQIRFPNGSKIIFKGMDKPAKLKSINNVSIIWIEECSEVKYAGFKELLGRLRHPTLELHMILLLIQYQRITGVTNIFLWILKRRFLF